MNPAELREACVRAVVMIISPVQGADRGSFIETRAGEIVDAVFAAARKYRAEQKPGPGREAPPDRVEVER